MALIEAHIVKVEREIGSDWGSIYTDHSEVKKLSTKRADLLEQAASLKKSGALAGIDYTERTKHDPATGRTYRNFYFDGAGALGSNGASAEDTGIDVVQPVGRKTDPDDAWRMCLNKGGELAVATMPLMPVDQRDFETQKTIARAWGEFFYFTPRPDGPGPSGNPPRGAYSEPNFDGPPPYTDDDIPY